MSDNLRNFLGDKSIDIEIIQLIKNLISNTVYGVSWNDIIDIAPSKNVIYNKINDIDTDLSLKANLVDGVVPISELPSSVVNALEYKGGWDASGGTYPTPAGLETGWYYIITVEGTIGGIDYLVGDWVIYNGTSWDKLTYDTYTSGDFDTDFGTKDTGDLAEGTNLYHTVARVEAIITAEIAADESIDNAIDFLILAHKNIAAAHHTKTVSSDINLASMAEKSHASLTNVLTSQHHTKTTSGEINLNDLLEKSHASLSNVLTSQHHIKTTSGEISLASLLEKSHASLTNVLTSQHHVKTVANELNHNDLANLNAGDVYEHISAAQLAALHAKYTNEEAQDAIGNILNDTSTIDFTYDDITPLISAIIKPTSIDNSYIALAAAIAWSKINKAGSNLNEIATRSHTVLSDKGTNTHPQIDTHIADNTKHFLENSIQLANLAEKAHSSLTGILTSDHHVKTVANELNHNDLSGLNAGDAYEHITQAQKTALHAKYTNTEAVAAVNATGLALANSKVIISQDADLLFILGRAGIGYAGFEDCAAFAHRDYMDIENFALLQSFAGNTYLNAPTGCTVNHAINGIIKMNMTVAGLQLASGARISEVENNDALGVSDTKLCTQGNTKAYHDANKTVAGDLSHNSLADLNAGDVYEHISQAQKNALHAVLTNLTELGTRNHNDLQNIDAGDIKHLSAAQVAALHTAYTDADARESLVGQHYSLTEGINGEKYLRIPYLNNILYCADKRYTITKTGNTITYNPAGLFNGNLSNYPFTILDGEVVTLNFDLIDKNEFVGNGLVYPYGKLYIHVYHIYHLGSVRARLFTKNADGAHAWRAWRTGTDISINGSSQFWEINFSGNYHCQEMEVEFTASGTDAWICELEWVLNRNLDYRAYPLLRKYSANNIYGNLNFKDSSNVTQLIITAAGLVDGVNISTLPALIAANTTQTEVESIITTECGADESIDNAIDNLISVHNIADNHIAHSGISIIAGTGLTGGGTITATRTINCNITQYTDGLAVTAMGVKGDANPLHHDRVVAGDLAHNSLTGLNAGDVYEHISAAQLAALHAKYTNEEAQDAIGNILDDGTVGEIVFTYDDVTPKISGVVQDGEIDHNALNNYAAGRHKTEAEMSLANLGTRNHASLSDAPTSAHHVKTVASELNLADLAEKDHANLTNVLTSQHHVKTVANELNLADLNEKSYNNLTDKPTILEGIGKESDIIVQSNDAEKTNADPYTNWLKFKEIICYKNLNARVSWQMKINDPGTVSVQVYINDIEQGDIHSVKNWVYDLTYHEDIIVKRGDKVQLYMRSSTNRAASVQNMKICYDEFINNDP